MLELLISFTGILCGYVLTYIAPQEISAGKKYFLILKKIVLGIIAIMQLSFFVQAQNLLLGLLFFFILGATFVITFFWKHFLLEIVNYITFLILLVLVSPKEAQLLLA
ncbi:MAG: hypothetical protein AABX37_05460, partial [Nanoarchaeota archaeon]